MSTDRTRINGQNVTCYFREEDVRDPQSAVGMIVRIAGMEGFEARYIALRDLDGDPGQDNKSRQFAPGTENRRFWRSVKARGLTGSISPADCRILRSESASILSLLRSR